MTMTGKKTGIYSATHKALNPGILAIVFTVLFNGGLYFVTSLSGKPYFPLPGAPIEVIMAFFQSRASSALLCFALQYGASIPLGIYTATMVSRLRFHGVRAAGVEIAQFGGIGAALAIMMGSFAGWALTYPEVSHNAPATQALFRFSFGIGGLGYTVPLGLLIAGIAVTGGLSGLLSRRMMIAGIVIGLIGELSSLDFLFPQALPLVPLTRFPGFVWLIAAGFTLPRGRSIELEQGIE